MTEIIDFLMDQWIFSGTLVALVALLIYGERPKKYQVVDTNGAITLMDDDNLIILDVREEKERKTGFINSATHIPMAQVKGKLDTFDKNKKILTYCKSGMRSNTTAELLCKNQFKDVYSLKGGFDAWQKAGLPINK
ncbi:MAG: rhodanese-like domain-containing protein [Gammaproteobacteria bacterium]|nr:rhodanese-like domain-containing protein [Gammaproteobacteria bacterium]